MTDDGTSWRKPERLDMPTGAVPFAEHVPYTVSELGLELDAPRDRRPLIIAGVAALVLILGLLVLLTRGGSTTLHDLAPGDCYSPAVEDVQASVSRHDCDGTHGAQLVGLYAASGSAYPGASELALFGEAACRTAAEEQAGKELDALAEDGIVLRIAVPDEQAWEKGSKDVACSFATPGATDLTKRVG